MLDLLLPVIVLIALCIVGLVWTGGMWDTESDNYGNFVMSLLRRLRRYRPVPGFHHCTGLYVRVLLAARPHHLREVHGGHSQWLHPDDLPILILCFAWTLCGLCRDNGLQVGSFVRALWPTPAAFAAKFLPAVIFIVACFIGFATGTSWGTIGIMVPLVCAVFDWDTQMTLLSVGLAASCAGGVRRPPVPPSPIPPSWLLPAPTASTLNHVATQRPMVSPWPPFPFVSFIIAGLVQSAVVCMIIAIVLMVATLLVIKAVTAKKHAGVFAEMAEADKVLYQK